MDYKSVGKIPIQRKTWLRFKDMAYSMGMTMGQAAAQAILEWMDRRSRDASAGE